MDPSSLTSSRIWFQELFTSPTSISKKEDFVFQQYLMFGGDCEKALRTYEKAFGGKVTFLCRYGDMPDVKCPEEQKNLVMHANFCVGDSCIMCADYPHKTTVGDNTFVMPSFETVEDARKAWGVLKEGGEVKEELGECFFAEIYGTLRDKYGINWMLMIEKESECSCDEVCAGEYNPECKCMDPGCHCREGKKGK